MAAPDRDILFIHIPKAAGSSVNTLLSEAFGGGVTRFRELEQAAFERRAADSRPLVFSAHPGGGFDRWARVLARAGPRFTFTFLRHPAERFVSEVWYNLPHLRKQGIDPHKVLEYPVAAHGLCGDLQVKTLAGVGAPRAYERPATRTDLLAAMRTLAGLDFFGLSEQFDASRQLLAARLGLDPEAETTPRVNVNPQRPKLDELDPEFRAAVEGHHLLDFELYEYAVALFQARLVKPGRHRT